MDHPRPENKGVSLIDTRTGVNPNRTISGEKLSETAEPLTKGEPETLADIPVTETRPEDRGVSLIDTRIKSDQIRSVSGEQLTQTAEPLTAGELKTLAEWMPGVPSHIATLLVKERRV